MVPTTRSALPSMVAKPRGMAKGHAQETDRTTHVQDRDRSVPPETLQRIQSCRLFCSQVSQTASMHSPPVTSTEINLHRILQSALSEIEQQLLGLEKDMIQKPLAATNTQNSESDEVCRT